LRASVHVLPSCVEIFTLNSYTMKQKLVHRHTVSEWCRVFHRVLQQYVLCVMRPLVMTLLPTPMVVAPVHPRFSFFPRTISRKTMQLGSPNSTYKCSSMSPRNPCILGSNSHRSRSRLTQPMPACVFALL